MLYFYLNYYSFLKTYFLFNLEQKIMLIINKLYNNI